MLTQLVAGCGLLALGGCAVLTQTLPPSKPTPQLSEPTLPVNPFPRANSVWLQTSDPVPVAMDKLVRYYQTQGYVVDTVDREGFLQVRAHTTLQLPERPVRLDVRASFGGLRGSVRLRATFVRLPVSGPGRAVPVYYQPALLPAPARQKQVRYTTWLAPARRAAFVELQRVCRGAFPEALLTYGNEVH